MRRDRSLRRAAGVEGVGTAGRPTRAGVRAQDAGWGPGITLGASGPTDPGELLGLMVRAVQGRDAGDHPDVSEGSRVRARSGAINLTDQERKNDIRRFVDEFRLPFPVALDERGKVRRRYGLI